MGQSLRGGAGSGGCGAAPSRARPEHVVLPLVERAVADPHRTRPGVAREIVPGRLREVATTVDPIHDLQRSVFGGLDIGDELHELVGFPIELQIVERLA
jgi:hypothetical protein